MIPARMLKCQTKMCQLCSKKGVHSNLFSLQLGKKPTILKKLYI